MVRSKGPLGKTPNKQEELAPPAIFQGSRHAERRRSARRGGLALVLNGYALDNEHAHLICRGEDTVETDTPTPAASVPVSYEVDGEQHVVIPAGGHSLFSPDHSDAVLAYKLKH